MKATVPMKERRLCNTLIRHPQRDGAALPQSVSSALSELASESLFQLCPDAILVTDADGVIRIANLRSTDLFGYTPEELFGKPIDDLVPERFRRSHRNERENYSAHPRTRTMGSSTNLFGLRKDGTEFPADIMLRPLECASNSYVMSFVRDITEQRAAQEALRHNDQLLRSVVDSIHDYAIFLLDSEGHVKTWNNVGQHIKGYTKEEIVGLHFSRFFTKEDLDRGKPAMLLSLAAAHGGAGDEGWRVRKDGSRFWAECTLTAIHGVLGEITGFAKVVRDISVRKEAEEAALLHFSDEVEAYSKALKASESRYRTVFQTSPDAVVISRIDDGTIVDVNQAFLDVTGHERSEVIGRTTTQLCIWTNSRDRLRVLDLLRSNQGYRDLEVKFKRKSAEVFWARLSASLTEVDGVACVLCFARDISESKLAEEEIRHLAFYDSLTGLPNRRLQWERLRQSLTASARSNRKGAVLFIDLDDFKNLNDTLGHKTGDLLLHEIGKRLSACTRDSDTVARLGGDEFVVIIEGLTESAEDAATSAKAVAEKISHALAEPYMLAGHQCFSTASIGIRVFASEQDNIDDVMQQADLAMYKSKSVGRKAIHFFFPALQVAANARVSLEDEIRRAIVTSQFQNYYQPQVERGHLVGVEALLRWNHPDRGFLPPGCFLPLAEETGLILPLGDSILKSAFMQAAAWGRRKETSHLSIAVNVSAHQFRHPKFVENVLNMLLRTGANPQNIRIELTESVLVDNLDDVVAKMGILKSHGLRFSLDDFGTGYSSLSYLRQLPLDQLKIDRCFVRDLQVDSGCRLIVQSIISLSQAMGLSVLAEGVETEEQRDSLACMGCHSLQGYLFSPALPLDELELWLADFAESANGIANEA